MLANLDNEVFFKQVFTDTEVFCAFVKDVIGIDLVIDKVETEKVIPSKVSAIKFRMDLFAESRDHRTIVEIQKVDYDYSFDRFAHYFIGNLIDMQRSSSDYSFEKEVYVIVVVTSAYRVSDKNGKPIKDDVLITDINPKNLRGETVDMYNHKMVILNTSHILEGTPARIRDWLTLIEQSIHNPHAPSINLNHPGIAKAAHLAEKDNLDPEQLAQAKEQEARKATLAILEASARKEEVRKQVLKAIQRGKLTYEEIVEDFEVSIEYITQLAAEIQTD